MSIEEGGVMGKLHCRLNTALEGEGRGEKRPVTAGGAKGGAADPAGGWGRA
jgi:hypothetical protein